MENNNSAVNDFLGEFSNNKEVNPFEDNLKDPFVEETKDEVVEKEDKPLPFNKDPKIQKFIEKEISKRLESFKGREEEKPATQQEVDDYYIRLIGNDTPEKVAMIKESIARDEQRLQMAEERAFNRLSQKEQDEVRADQEAEEELGNAFDNIEENYDVDITSNNPVARKTRQEFVSFVERIAPKDRNGDVIDYPDMNSAWETFSEIKKATSTPSRAKELASRSMARSAETTVKPQEKSNWDAADAFIESLGK